VHLKDIDDGARSMTVHLVNPSDLSFGVGVITPRWLFVLAGATPTSYGLPRITDETLEPFDTSSVQPGDIVGVGIHTDNALRGYEIGTLARQRGATVVLRCAASRRGASIASNLTASRAAVRVRAGR
jgi:hypothetical protein